ncbi:MAG: alpha/beta hydrolase [Pseudomonadota bacterium]
MRNVVTPDGVRLNYDDQGTGMPVLCLPGLTRNMDDFLPFLKGFKYRVRVIRLDFRGRGGSDWAPVETYSVPQEAADVITLLDHLNLPEVAILGTSRGGLVAMMLAVTARSRLMGVFLNDVGPVVAPEGLDAIMDYIGKPPPYRDLAEAAAAMPAAHPSFRNVSAAQWAAFVRALWQETDDGLALRYDPELRTAVAASFDTSKPAPDLWPLFDAFEGLPLALLRGAGSNILTEATAQDMIQRRPDMLFAELADRGHVPFLDEPGAVALMESWLEHLHG